MATHDSETPEPKPLSLPTISGNTTTGRPGQIHIGWLDGLRALAAFYVILFHFGAYTTGPVRPGNLHPWWAELHLGYGHQAVALFIVLSGFCLMLPVVGNQGRLSTDAKTFLKKRALRILPAYYASIVFSVVVIWIVPVLHQPLSFRSYLSHEKIAMVQRLFMLHDIFCPLWSVNGPLWSVGVEWKIYLLFPALIWFWRRFGAFWTLVLSVVVSFPLSYWMTAHGYTWANPHFLSLFMLGAIGAYIAFSPDKPWEVLRSKIPWICVMAACFWGVFCYSLEPVTQDFVWGVGCSSFLVWCVHGAMGGKWVRWALNLKPLVWLGTFSYSLYLLHFPMLHLFFKFSAFGPRVTHFQMVGYFACEGIPAIILVAYLFSLVFEKPFVRRKAPAKQSAPRLTTDNRAVVEAR